MLFKSLTENLIPSINQLTELNFINTYMYIISLSCLLIVVCSTLWLQRRQWPKRVQLLWTQSFNLFNFVCAAQMAHSSAVIDQMEQWINAMLSEE